VGAWGWCNSGYWCSRRCVVAEAGEQLSAHGFMHLFVFSTCFSCFSCLGKGGHLTDLNGGGNLLCLLSVCLSLSVSRSVSLSLSYLDLLGKCSTTWAMPQPLMSTLLGFPSYNSCFSLAVSSQCLGSPPCQDSTACLGSTLTSTPCVLMVPPPAFQLPQICWQLLCSAEFFLCILFVLVGIIISLFYSLTQILVGFQKWR
jgi:hypothetical protein